MWSDSLTWKDGTRSELPVQPLPVGTGHAPATAPLAQVLGRARLASVSQFLLHWTRPEKTHLSRVLSDVTASTGDRCL